MEGRPGLASVEVVLMPFVSPRPLSVLGARVCRSARGRVALCKVPSISLERIWLSCRLWFNSELGLVRSWPGIGSGLWERLRFCRSVPARRLLCQLRWRVRLVWTWLAAANRSYVKLRHCTAISRHGGGETRRSLRREKIFSPNHLWRKWGVAALVLRIHFCSWGGPRSCIQPVVWSGRRA